MLPAKRNTGAVWIESCAFTHRLSYLAGPASVRIRVKSGDGEQSSPLEGEVPKARKLQNESPQHSVDSRPILASGKRALPSRKIDAGLRAWHQLQILQRSR